MSDLYRLISPDKRGWKDDEYINQLRNSGVLIPVTIDLYDRNPGCVSSGHGHHHTIADDIDAGACFTAIGDTGELSAQWSPGSLLIVEDDGSIRKWERADWDDE